MSTSSRARSYLVRSFLVEGLPGPEEGCVMMDSNGQVFSVVVLRALGGMQWGPREGRCESLAPHAMWEGRERDVCCCCWEREASSHCRQREPGGGRPALTRWGGCQPTDPSPLYSGSRGICRDQPLLDPNLGGMDTSGLGEWRWPEEEPLSLSGLGSSHPSHRRPPSPSRPEGWGSRDGK